MCTVLCGQNNVLEGRYFTPRAQYRPVQEIRTSLRTALQSIQLTSFSLVLHQKTAVLFVNEDKDIVHAVHSVLENNKHLFPRNTFIS